MELQAWIDLKIVPELKKYTVKEFIVVHKDLVDELAERKNVINDTNLKITESKMAKSLMNLKNLSKNKITNVDNVIVTKKQNTKSVKTITAKTSKIETEVTTKVIVDKVRIYWKHPSHQKQDDLYYKIIEDMEAKKFIIENPKIFFMKIDETDYESQKLKEKYKAFLEDPAIKQIAMLNNKINNELNKSKNLNDLMYIASVSEKIQRLKESVISVYNKTIDTMLKMNMSRRAMIENDQKMVEYNMIDKEDDINILNNKLINLLENKEISLDELRENDILIDN